jgi:hypothetical protein
LNSARLRPHNRLEGLQIIGRSNTWSYFCGIVDLKHCRGLTSSAYHSRSGSTAGECARFMCCQASNRRFTKLPRAVNDFRLAVDHCCKSQLCHRVIPFLPMYAPAAPDGSKSTCKFANKAGHQEPEIVFSSIEVLHDTQRQTSLHQHDVVSISWETSSCSAWRTTVSTSTEHHELHTTPVPAPAPRFHAIRVRPDLRTIQTKESIDKEYGHDRPVSTAIALS